MIALTKCSASTAIRRCQEDRGIRRDQARDRTAAGLVVVTRNCNPKITPYPQVRNMVTS